MKTAMQELIEAIELITKKYKRGLSTEEILDMCNNQLDKEKEQIIDAYVKGFDISAEGWNGEYGIEDFNNIKEEIKAEQYYNQTYNNETIN